MKRELIEVSPRVRVENGPARRKAIASEDMLPELDKAGKADPNKQGKATVLPDGRILAPHYKLGFADALGRRIIAGREFTYLDHYGPLVWYVYQLRPMGINAKGELLFPKDNPLIHRPPQEPEDEVEVRKEERFLPVAISVDRDQALLFAGGIKEA